LKIARVVTSLNPANGGVTEAVCQYVLNSRPSKINICLVCFDEPCDPWIIELKSKGVEVYALGNGWSRYQFHFGYVKWIKKNYSKYDLFIFDGIWQFHIVPALIFKFIGLKYIIQPHGMLSHVSRGWSVSYITKLVAWFFVERVVTKNASKIVFTTTEEERVASLSYPFNVFNSAIIPLGIEGYAACSPVSSEFVSKFLPVLGDCKYILFLSRIDKIKGVDLLVDAILENNVFHDGYRYLIVGPDNSGLSDRLKKKIDRAGKSEYFFWYGMVSGSLKWDVISNANAFILPSHHENFGIVVTEAMSAAVPVLISDNVNINEVVLRYRGGVVFSNTPKSIADTLFRWFDMKTEMQVSMGESALKCFQLEFNKVRMITSFDAMFFDVLSGVGCQSE